MNRTVNPSSNLVNKISLVDGKISLSDFAILPPAMPRPRKRLTKRQAEDLTGLQRKMIEVVEKNEAKGLLREHVYKRSIEREKNGYGRKVPVSTINSIMKGNVPSIKTLEGVALAYDEDPLEFFRAALDDPISPEPFASSPVYRVWILWQRTSSENLPAVSERIEELINFMRRKEKS